MYTNVLNVCLIGLLSIGYTSSQSVEDQLLEKYFHDRCYKYSSDAQAFDKLKNQVTEFVKYSEYAFTNVPGNKKEFCKQERPNLSIRMTQITKIISSCLPKEEKYLEEFLKVSYDEFLHFLCHNGGENMDAYFSSQGAECRQLIEKNQGDQISQCFDKIFKPFSHHIKKEELCADIDVAKKCFARSLEQDCTNFKAFRQLNEKFFTYINKPCAGCMVQINNLLLLLVSSVLIFNLKNYF